MPGRFEIVCTTPLIVVDYAHTPDGLTATLATARKLVEPGGRLVCVFGCGGGRDRGKRPLMAAAVDEAADLVILTSDNPRHKDPQAIAEDTLAGWQGGRSQWHVELDRAAAVRFAVEKSQPSDVIVVAGKGHESTQEVGDQKIPMSDPELVREALAAG